MKIRMIKTGEVRDANDSYALRLIEHGKAVACQAAGRKQEKRDAKPGK